MLNFKKGFTLAETLIVIAIIGIVAALTLPNVIDNYKRKVYVSQLQRVYNLISNAAANLLVEQDVDDLRDTYLAEEGGPARFMEKYLHTTNVCRRGNLSPCMASVYTQNNEYAADWRITQLKYANVTDCATLAIGASVCMSPTLDELSGSSFMVIDVNGKEEPNKAGRDLFTVMLHKNGSLSDTESPGSCSGGDYGGTYIGGGCFSKIQNAGWKMDY